MNVRINLKLRMQRWHFFILLFYLIFRGLTKSYTRTHTPLNNPVTQTLLKVIHMSKLKKKIFLLYIFCRVSSKMNKLHILSQNIRNILTLYLNFIKF